MTSLVDRRSGARQPRARRSGTSRSREQRRYIPLLHRLAGINALLVVASVAVTIAVIAPAKVSALAVDEELAAVLVAVALVVVTNVYLLRRVVGPLQTLTSFARHVDLSSLGQRIPNAKPTSEAGELALTFNEMLSRLEASRREFTSRVLGAQERERLRIAQELHDQVGQDLTGVLLGLSSVAAQAPPGLREQVESVRDAVRDSLEGVRRIAVELRPEALDDLGLHSALAVLAERFSSQLGLEVSEHIVADVPPLPAEIDLVVYRVAQEALTNVARHSASGRADLRLERDDDQLILTVRDYGLGLPARHAAGTGIRGMHERASLIGASLTIGNSDSGPGCEVRLEVPLEAPR